MLRSQRVLASPGAAVGRAYFTADDAETAAKKVKRSSWFVIDRPEDVHGMMVAQGILTAQMDFLSHAAVVALVGERRQSLVLTPSKSLGSHFCRIDNNFAG